MALALLRERGYTTSGLRSKSWDEFTEPGAPALDGIDSLDRGSLEKRLNQIGKTETPIGEGG